MAATPSARARAIVVWRIFAWARWIPSKAPSAVTDGASSAGKDGSPRRIRMEDSLGPRLAALGGAHAEQRPVVAIDAREPGEAGRGRHRLAMEEGARLRRVEREPGKLGQRRVQRQERGPQRPPVARVLESGPGHGLLEPVRAHA